MVVRRSLWSYGSYGFLALLCLSKLYLVQTTYTLPWVIALLCSLIIFIRLVFKPYYPEVKGTSLIINRDLLYQESVEIDDIEKISLADNPFTKSHIELKDYKIGKEFNYYIVNTKDFNRMMEELKLNVE